jgi:hypothetical protein
MRNYNGTIGNRTRELSACSLVPQPTAPPAAYPHMAGTTEIKIGAYIILAENLYVRDPFVDLNSDGSIKINIIKN